MPERIAFTSVSTWVARALFCSSFWDTFTRWGEGELIVPARYFPLQDISDSADHLPQHEQLPVKQGRWLNQWWKTMDLINGYRLGGQTRTLIQNRLVEQSRGREKWLRSGHTLAASSLYHLGLSQMAEQAYWRWVNRLPVVDEAQRFLVQIRASGLAISGSEDDRDHPYVLAAQRLGLPIALMIRSWDNLSSKSTAIPRVDGYLVWSEEMKRELKLLAPWISDEAIHIVGASQFDHHQMAWVPDRQTFFDTIGLAADSGGPLLHYSCGGNHVGEADLYAVKTLIELLQANAFPAGTQLLVRLHPFLARQRFNALLYDSVGEQARVSLWPPQDHQSPLSDYDIQLGSLAYQTVNINIASTMALDSMMFDKPVVNVAFNGGAPLNYVRDIRDFYQFDHYRTIIERGGSALAETPDDLKRHILDAIEHPAARAAQRAATVRFHIGEHDGLAGQRTANALRTIFKVGD